MSQLLGGAYKTGKWELSNKESRSLLELANLHQRSCPGSETMTLSFGGAS